MHVGVCVCVRLGPKYGTRCRWSQWCVGRKTVSFISTSWQSSYWLPSSDYNQPCRHLGIFKLVSHFAITSLSLLTLLPRFRIFNLSTNATRPFLKYASVLSFGWCSFFSLRYSDIRHKHCLWFLKSNQIIVSFTPYTAPHLPSPATTSSVISPFFSSVIVTLPLYIITSFTLCLSLVDYSSSHSLFFSISNTHTNPPVVEYNTVPLDICFLFCACV